MPFEFVKDADGKYIMDLKSFTLSFDVRDSAHFDLTNLFNGNKELSKLYASVRFRDFLIR